MAGKPMPAMAARLGALTVGQSPRSDIVPELRAILGQAVEIVEAGALDGLSAEEIAQMAPAEGDRVLVTRLRDGTSTRIGHHRVVPLLQGRLDALSPRVEAVLLLCTGSFEPFLSFRPILYAERLMLAMVQALAPHHLGVITPDPDQVDEQQGRWRPAVDRLSIVSASPYTAADALPPLAVELAGRGADLIILDSLGYGLAMKAAVRRAADRPVLLPRTVMARAAAELLG
jgi:protein AroM